MADVSVGLLVRLEAREGQEEEVQRFLEGGLGLVDQEPETIAWFAIRMGPSTVGIFDAVGGEDGRRAHLEGPLAARLGELADEFLSQPPSIANVEVLADKLHG